MFEIGNVFKFGNVLAVKLEILSNTPKYLEIIVEAFFSKEVVSHHERLAMELLHLIRVLESEFHLVEDLYF